MGGQDKNSASGGERFRLQYPLPRELRELLHTVPFNENTPEDYATYLEKVLKKMGVEKCAEIKETWGPFLTRAIKTMPTGCTHAEALAHLQRLTQEATDNSRSLSATLPILFVNKKAEAQPNGSSVLININRSMLLLTAAHVLDGWEHDDFIVPGRESYVCVTGDLYKMRLPASGNRCDDPLDAAFCRLDDHCSEALALCHDPITRQDVCLHPEPKRSFRICGYPKSGTAVKKEVISARLQSVEGIEIKDFEYQQAGIDCRRNIAIRVNRKRMFSPFHGGALKPPGATGMSGGGIYVEMADPKAGSIKFLLVGIVTDDYPDKWLLIGTRLSVFIDFIEFNQPEIFAP